LDDRTADNFHPEFPEPSSSDLHDVTIREPLGMRSGFTDGGLPATAARATSMYANIDYDILAAIVDHVTGRRLTEAVRAGVLSGRGLDGLVFKRVADGNDRQRPIAIARRSRDGGRSSRLRRRHAVGHPG
jgi:hypothetical protein